jgi:hypothetical protein
VFSREFIEQMREDMMTAFWEAIQRPGGTVGRGPRRWYVEVHPQASGFTEVVMHSWFLAMCERVLGPEYKIVEIGFDTPFYGAQVHTKANSCVYLSIAKAKKFQDFFLTSVDSHCTVRPSASFKTSQ